MHINKTTNKIIGGGWVGTLNGLPKLRLVASKTFQAVRHQRIRNIYIKIWIDQSDFAKLNQPIKDLHLG